MLIQVCIATELASEIRINNFVLQCMALYLIFFFFCIGYPYTSHNSKM